ncbi:DUF3617 domain-containing protein [Croceicoccus estronivorus]|uniref:DUF3617 domain-containing protein n=1 Tax=Croceicoccus estronivorus TaxID=1172626 RepID=UPI0009EEFD9D|nr:DUF3617 family protein [Croceicoccus estronivorus]
MPRIAAALLCIFSIPALAQQPELAALDKLKPGNWEIRFRSDNTRQRICLRDGRELIQLRHTASGCSRFVVEDTADRVTVQYTCRGHGYGRTHIRRESAQIAQIESQGIVDGLPFQFSAEARWVGRCGG